MVLACIMQGVYLSGVYPGSPELGITHVRQRRSECDFRSPRYACAGPPTQPSGLEINHWTCGGFYSVCDHGKHRNAKRLFWVTFVPPLPVPKVTPKIVPFSKTNLALQLHYADKVETPM